MQAVATATNTLLYFTRQLQYNRWSQGVIAALGQQQQQIMMQQSQLAQSLYGTATNGGVVTGVVAPPLSGPPLPMGVTSLAVGGPVVQEHK